ncbi:SPOSA6832_02144 [Sporobolomyces salmonicolor]|uniref:SPOSA6832_02144-mRNA-1:cds n=1 Tax=Sporidiobolus salmonicolor TaxID=5005 RepID=A0A0D6EKJ8_SPOSA|nr:SPOSA6832_02144 [Sporobolomyces salmonicolor]
MRSTADPVSRLASTSTQHSQVKTTSTAGHSNTASSTKSAKKTTLQAHSSKNNPVKTTSSRYWHTTSSPSNRATAAHHNATDHKAERTRHAATATETSKSASSNAFLSALAKSALSAHNDLRAKHNATALTWHAPPPPAPPSLPRPCADSLLVVGDFKHGGGVALGSGENIAAYKNAAGNVTYAVDLWAGTCADAVTLPRRGSRGVGLRLRRPGLRGRDRPLHADGLEGDDPARVRAGALHAADGPDLDLGRWLFLLSVAWLTGRGRRNCCPGGWAGGLHQVCEYLEAGNLVGTTAAQTADYFSANVQE